MENILDLIIRNTLLREQDHFSAFSEQEFHLDRMTQPVNVIEQWQHEFFLICEIKRKSPSRGIIRDPFDPLDILSHYMKGGASAISVITESCFFDGKKEFIPLVKSHCTLPVLRKDFLVHPFQIYESYNLGADLVLLIASVLEDALLARLYNVTVSLGMQAVIEVHDEADIEKALKINPRIIGINNRDLRTFTVDVSTSFRLMKFIPPTIKVISESGIQTADQISALKQDGFSGVLIGETLLQHQNVTKILRILNHG